MSEKFEGFREAKPQITEEEKMLAEKAHEAGGESKLPKEEAIRLIALRYMRGGQVTSGITHQPLSESDAVELATIEVYETSGELNVTPEVFDRKKVLRKKLGGK